MQCDLVPTRASARYEIHVSSQPSLARSTHARPPPLCIRFCPMLTLILYHVHALADAHPAETAVEQALSGSQLSNSKGPAGRSAASNSSIQAAHRPHGLQQWLPRFASPQAKLWAVPADQLQQQCQQQCQAISSTRLTNSSAWSSAAAVVAEWSQTHLGVGTCSGQHHQPLRRTVARSHSCPAAA